MKNKFEIREDTTAIFVYSKGKYLEFLIDTADLPIVQSFKGTWSANWGRGKVYARQRKGNWRKGELVDYPLHRVITNCPVGLEPDHIDGNTLDNRRSNLRVSTHTQNMGNQHRKSNTASGIQGVTWNVGRGKWHARLAVNLKRVSLGYYDCKYEAARAVNIRRVSVGLTPHRKAIKLG